MPSRALILWGMLVTVLGVCGTARAELTVSPTRVVLTEKQAHAYLSLRHKGDKPTKYRVSMVYFRMAPDGSLAAVETPTPEDRSVHRYLRFSPRQVLIPPGAEQMVRVMVKAPKNLPPGDYRTHVQFEPLPEDGAVEPTEEEKKIGIQLKARISIAVPVTYHHGTSPAGKISLANLKLATKDKLPAFSAEWSREGNQFPYGDLRLTFTPTGGEPRKIQDYLGLSLYIDKRLVLLNLPETETKLSNGTLRLEFLTPKEEGEKLLAVTETKLL